MPRKSLSGFLQRAPFLDTQIKAGNNNAYQPLALTGFQPIYADAALADPMRIAFTPVVDAWWEVFGCIGLLRCDTATYLYAYQQLQLNITDADGQGAAVAAATQRSDVNQFGMRAMSRIFKLSAGVAYTCTMGLSLQTAVSWSYYQGKDYLWMHGKGWPR
jgi:hypothetical protein